ncbi:glutamyl-tRNA reductase [Conchiformibius steedae]|uniref:Glutamyl-tRNA reductase n=1 Tax=Conchiformibius steedae TaxID=153493 RepID=A0A3P2A410_9NEIS|nr:glutamyl-tRNA reductase [Conchiformibius steedae]RRD90182.1 glutamyl-tRNA reductase [Conchiformibius steedae]
MKLTVVGLNHQTAPLAIREQLAFTAANLPEALRDLNARAAAEAVILSTCNRSELYCVGDADQIVRWWADYHQLPEAEIRPYLYTHGCSDTVRHAYRVACGLDSMVLGEPQILGQMKDAVRTARHEGSIGTWLNGLFQKTFSAAKDVRTCTSVGDSTVSMASAGLKMAQQLLGDIKNLNILLIGAGEMIELVATYFAAAQPQNITVANRTLARASELCERLGANATPCLLNDLPHLLQQYDVVVSSTAAPLPIVGKGMMEHAMRLREGKPMFLLDLAVPRDIEAQVAEIDGVHLYTVDDMVEVVQNGKEARREAADAAEEMVAQKVEDFIEWQKSRQRVPLICALRDEGERARRQVLNNAIKQLAKGASPEEVLERLSVQLTNKLLHAPTRVLNKGSEDAPMLVDAVSQIYRLQHPQGTAWERA